MAFSVVLLIGSLIVVGALIAARRAVVVDPSTLIQGMFRYESDLGWPHGVQESDGERAWVPANERPVAPRAASAPTAAPADAPDSRPASTWEAIELGRVQITLAPVALIRVRRG